jgi:probable addiction module antidote protein
MVKVIPFETARHLDNPEVIAGYLSEAFQSGDEKLILRAIHNIARAQNISKIARKVGMSRTSLYWKENTKPEFTTVLKVLSAVGVRLQPAIGGGAPKRTSARGRKGRGQTAPDHAHK